MDVPNMTAIENAIDQSGTHLEVDRHLIKSERFETDDDPRYQMILDHYGIRHQILKLAEEDTELADAAFRLYKNMDASGITVRENIHHVLEEIVDVEIVGKQMRLHYLTDYPDCEVVKIRNSKLNRTVERMSAGAFDGV